VNATHGWNGHNPIGERLGGGAGWCGVTCHAAFYKLLYTACPYEEPCSPLALNFLLQTNFCFGPEILNNHGSLLTLVTTKFGINADLIEFAPQRIVNDDGPAIREGLDRMAHITRHDGDQAGSYDLGCAVDGYLKLTIDHLIDLFLRMEVLMNG
jgi:hypothetical protein